MSQIAKIKTLADENSVVIYPRTTVEAVHGLEDFATKQYVDSKTVTVPQSDWNQNDASADDYIKNRTHWKEENYVELLPLTTLTLEDSDDGKVAMLANSSNLVAGNTYHCVFNGTSYECMSIDATDIMNMSCVAIGGLSIFGFPDNGEQFIYLDINDDAAISELGYGGMFVAFGEDTEVSFAISGLQTIYHHLDKNYIEDMYGSTKYINVDILPETTIEIQQDMTEEPTPLTSQMEYLREGGVYSVLWNGVDYECVGEVMQIEDFMGVKISSDAFEIFSSIDLFQNTGYYALITAFDRSSEVTISIVGSYEDVKKIDPKYIPQSDYNSNIINTGNGSVRTINAYDTNAMCAFAEGTSTIASGDFSHAEGIHTIASGEGQHVQGKFNMESNNYAHIVGNGLSVQERSNAHTLDWDGNAWYAGNIKIGGTGYDDASELSTVAYVDSNTTNKVPTSRTINGKSLSSDISLTANDVGATSFTPVTVSIAASDWSSNTATVSCSAVTSTNTLIVAPAPSSYTVWGNSKVRASAQAAGSITFSCDTTPTDIIYVNIVALG